MFARIARYEVPPDRIIEAAGAFRDAVEAIRGLDGLVDAYVLAERESQAQLLTITVWETEAAMMASRVATSRARTEAVHTVGGSVESAAEYEIVFHERA